MTFMYDFCELGSIEHPVIDIILREYTSLPEIQTLDEYIHFTEELKRMRARSTKFVPERFYMEFALLTRINDYDQKIGMPEFVMPKPDGKGGHCKRDDAAIHDYLTWVEEELELWVFLLLSSRPEPQSVVLLKYVA